MKKRTMKMASAELKRWTMALQYINRGRIYIYIGMLKMMSIKEKDECVRILAKVGHASPFVSHTF